VGHPFTYGEDVVLKAGVLLLGHSVHADQAQLVVADVVQAHAGGVLAAVQRNSALAQPAAVAAGHYEASWLAAGLLLRLQAEKLVEEALNWLTQHVAGAAYPADGL
jgi:hypothetical protein